MCLWFRLRIPDDMVWEKRNCPPFFERMPQWDEAQHLNYALRWMDIGRNSRASKRAMFFSLAALTISIVGLVLKFL